MDDSVAACIARPKIVARFLLARGGEGMKKVKRWTVSRAALE
jgi:hypothetical protein